MKTLRDTPPLKGKKILVRVDFNVPMDEQGNVKNDKRMRHALPTLEYLLDQGARQLILMTHVGRPKGEEPRLKTDKIARHLEKLIGQKVAKVDGWENVPDTRIVLLENLRFHHGEKSKDQSERDAFGKELAGLADFYVNEAFSNSHRAHASMTSVSRFIPGFVGLGVEKEVTQIEQALRNPERPLIALIGGLKADKLPAIDYLLGIADHILVAGALGFALLKAKGIPVGSSRFDEEGMTQMNEFVQEVIQSHKVHLPEDAVIADEWGKKANTRTVPLSEIPDGWMALDIGPRTTQHYAGILKSAKTVLWFGPVGVFEWKAFRGGTESLAEAMVRSGAKVIVGGGDSAGAVEALGLEKEMALVSTGGGASLQLIEGKTLPGIEVLK